MYTLKIFTLRTEGMPGVSKLLLLCLQLGYARVVFSVYTTAAPHGTAITKMRFYNSCVKFKYSFQRQGGFSMS